MIPRRPSGKFTVPPPPYGTFAVGIALALSVAGCVPDKREVLVARQSYTEVMRSLVALRKAGKITDAQARLITPVSLAARKALNLAEAAAIEGDWRAVGRELKALANYLRALLATRVQASSTLDFDSQEVAQ